MLADWCSVPRPPPTRIDHWLGRSIRGLRRHARLPKACVRRGRAAVASGVARAPRRSRPGATSWPGRHRRRRSSRRSGRSTSSRPPRLRPGRLHGSRLMSFTTNSSSRSSRSAPGWPTTSADTTGAGEARRELPDTGFTAVFAHVPVDVRRAPCGSSWRRPTGSGSSAPAIATESLSTSSRCRRRVLGGDARRGPLRRSHVHRARPDLGGSRRRRPLRLLAQAAFGELAASALVRPTSWPACCPS